MRKISIKRIEIQEIDVLQTELLNYITMKSATMIPTKNTDLYFQNLLLMEIAQEMYYSFRGKVERANKSIATLNCSVKEAVVLLQVCNDRSTIRDGFEKFVMQKFIGLIHKELINLI